MVYHHKTRDQLKWKTAVPLKNFISFMKILYFHVLGTASHK